MRIDDKTRIGFGRWKTDGAELVIEQVGASVTICVNGEYFDCDDVREVRAVAAVMELACNSARVCEASGGHDD